MFKEQRLSWAVVGGSRIRESDSSGDGSHHSAARAELVALTSHLSEFLWGPIRFCPLIVPLMSTK